MNTIFNLPTLTPEQAKLEAHRDRQRRYNQKYRAHKAKNPALPYAEISENARRKLALEAARKALFPVVADPADKQAKKEARQRYSREYYLKNKVAILDRHKKYYKEDIANRVKVKNAELPLSTPNVNTSTQKLLTLAAIGLIVWALKELTQTTKP